MIEYKMPHAPEEITNVPFTAQITQNTITGVYTIHLSKYGTKKQGFSIPLLPEQIERLKWWY
jgi:hypothetical protein